MVQFGYKLMTEEHSPQALLRNARRAEEAGFDFLAISDHYHPWISEQGHAGFAWSILGGIAAQTERVALMTAVTCPFLRYHPALIAQAAATIAIMSGGRFTLGLGAGEQLNEHVVGHGWPAVPLRHEMLVEAIEIIRLLWQGGKHSYEGDHLTLEEAQLFDLPEQSPAIVVAAGGPDAARLAADMGDGMIATEAEAALIHAWEEAGGGTGAKYAEIALCWADDEDSAIKLAHERFAWSVTGWKVMAELPNVDHFEAVSRLVHPADVAAQVPCGPDPERHIAAVQQYLDAGFDHLILTGIGPDQEGFLRFWQEQLAPRLQALV